MRTLQLYATGSATATSVAQVTIPAAGRIVGVQIDFIIDSVTDNTLVRVELSKVPTNQIATNGALDPFLEVGQSGNFVTSGLAITGQNAFFPVDVSVRQGEIIYVHATVAGTATYYFNAILHYN
jgi:hypothetical protein